MVYSLKTSDFEGVRLKLASPESIREWSHGEILKPETINYRTQKPERDGLFCEKIFGPTKDYECACGKYKKIRYKGLVCDKCGVEVTRAIVRRERMGHIELAVPVSHIWYLRGVPSKFGLVLDMSMQALEKVIYFANFIVTDVDENAKTDIIDQLAKEYKAEKADIDTKYETQLTALMAEESDKTKREAQTIELNDARDKELEELEEDYRATQTELKELVPMALITEAQYKDMALRFGHIFNAGIGAEAVRRLFERIDLDVEIPALEKLLSQTSGAKRKKMIQRLRLLTSMKKNGIRPEWMVLTALPVIPPDLRPMVALDGGRFATSDLNDLYRRVINRNNRLKRLQELHAPEVIRRNEKRMLQEAVDALIDNSARRSKTTTSSTGQKRQLKSLADILKGKQGRFRQNLLGKRIDYSGRSVVVVGPQLNLDQCGLPKKMALELFRPFVISKLIEREYVHNIRSANRFIEHNSPVVWDILEEIIVDAYVMLNRAPTLHRLGIQAFRPTLIEGKAIHLHPLVCAAFNADFDGDQMAVHVPLTEEAKAEARDLMLASNNLLKPSTGRPIANPSHDMSWGCYYITACEEINGRVRSFSSIQELKTAHSLGEVKIYEKANVKMQPRGAEAEAMVETSLGRILFNEVLPEKLPFYNEQITKKGIGNIITEILEHYSFEDTAKVLDEFKNLGFRHITQSGYSWGMDDVPELTDKTELIEKGNALEEEVLGQYDMGLLTKDEKHSKIVEIWTNIKEEIAELGKGALNPHGSVASMIHSGSRGSWGQMTQMVGMKGLVSNPAGDIIELPIKSNFKEGFEVLEYFIATHGTRKGLADTALRTANAGYLTRRLVDVAQDVVVTAEDCGDDRGVVITKEESEAMGSSVLERITGRILLKDIKDGRKKIVAAGTLVTNDVLEKLKDMDLENIHVRSVSSCRLLKGVCQQCYGLDLARNTLVELGASVGIVAAQSIGEPGTQLTMRTFHSGGVASSGDITQGLPRVDELFEARTPKKKAFLAEHDGKITIIEEPRKLVDEDGKPIISTNYGDRIVQLAYRGLEFDKYKMKEGYTLEVELGAQVEKGDVLMLDAKNHKIKAKRAGVVSKEPGRLIVGSEHDMIEEYVVPKGYTIFVSSGEEVTAGEQLTDGSVELRQLFTLRGRDAVKQYVMKEIQKIYSSQGGSLNDKHIEIIVKQMLSRVLIKDPKDTDLLPGAIMEKAVTFAANNKARAAGLEPATYEELFLGISKVSLSTNSFLSSASFQETSKVLINASLNGQVDELEGLKENVIIGRLIPAGTGFRKKEVELSDEEI
jgi:DNA-directed RNA polymerase subunit beta'